MTWLMAACRETRMLMVSKVASRFMGCASMQALSWQAAK